jgi:hypothetical protein
MHGVDMGPALGPAQCASVTVLHRTVFALPIRAVDAILDEMRVLERDPYSCREGPAIRCNASWYCRSAVQAMWRCSRSSATGGGAVSALHHQVPARDLR